MERESVAGNELDTAVSAQDGTRVLSLAEQPGGRVLLRNGTPAGVASLADAASESFRFLQESQSWIGPVCQAAILYSDCEGCGKAKILTPWGDENAAEFADPEKHSAYVAYLRSEIGRHHAWLWPLLDSARAGVVVIPAGVNSSVGSFAVSVANQPGAQFDIPGLAPLLALLPFAVEGETAQ